MGKHKATMAARYLLRPSSTLLRSARQNGALRRPAVAAHQSLLPTLANCPAPHQSIAIRTYFFFPEKANNRIKDIQVNPKSVGSQIKPGNLIDKFYEKTRNTRTIPVELAKGYFWMIGDLKETGGKPTLSNQYLIPAENAQMFPSLLAGVTTLSGEDVELPEFFIRKNRESRQGRKI